MRRGRPAPGRSKLDESATLRAEVRRLGALFIVTSVLLSTALSPILADSVAAYPAAGPEIRSAGIATTNGSGHSSLGPSPHPPHATRLEDDYRFTQVFDSSDQAGINAFFQNIGIVQALDITWNGQAYVLIATNRSGTHEFELEGTYHGHEIEIDKQEADVIADANARNQVWELFEGSPQIAPADSLAAVLNDDGNRDISTLHNALIEYEKAPEFELETLYIEEDERGGLVLGAASLGETSEVHLTSDGGFSDNERETLREFYERGVFAEKAAAFLQRYENRSATKDVSTTEPSATLSSTRTPQSTTSTSSTNRATPRGTTVGAGTNNDQPPGCSVLVDCLPAWELMISLLSTVVLVSIAFATVWYWDLSQYIES